MARLRKEDYAYYARFPSGNFPALNYCINTYPLTRGLNNVEMEGFIRSLVMQIFTYKTHRQFIWIKYLQVQLRTFP